MEKWRIPDMTDNNQIKPSSYELTPEELDNIEKLKKSICLHRWTQPCIQIDSGHSRMCCRTFGANSDQNEILQKKSEVFLNSQFDQDRRSEMLKGIRDQDCNQCWRLEDQGITSPRKGLDEFLMYYQYTVGYKKDELLKKLATNDPELHKAHSPFMLEISLGNLCNLSCIYCNEDFSSRWAQEKISVGEVNEKFMRKKVFPTKDIMIEAFWDWMRLEGAHTLKCICFIGGETIITPELFEILNKFYELFKQDDIQTKRQHKIVIQIVTNLNIPEPQFDLFLQQIDKLTEYFRFEILISMESVEEKAEYIRNGLSWKLFDKNIHRIFTFQNGNPNYQLGFIMTYNLLSLTSTRAFLEYVYQLYKKYKHAIYLGKNLLAHPTYLAVQNLDQSYVRYIDEALDFLNSIPEINSFDFNKDITWTGYIHFLEDLKNSLQKNMQFDSEQQKIFSEWTVKNDSRTGKNFKETFPEYTDYLV